MLLIRWVGERPASRISFVAFLLVIVLGSAVGNAVVYPHVPLFHCLPVVTVVVGFNRLLNALTLE